MNPFVKKWSLLKVSLFMAIVMIGIRILIDNYNLDIIAINPLISALVTGVIFTIAVIFTGTLTDYKESEKIPSELAASIKSLYYDTAMFSTVDPAMIEQYRKSVRNLHSVIVSNFRSNIWDLNTINQAEIQVNMQIAELGRENVAPPILAKMRNELTAIDKISNRIKQIKDTDFIPAAYAITEMSIAFVLIILLFIKSDSLTETTIVLAAISMMITGLYFLIKDMDDPFEVDAGASADVDLFLIFQLDQYLIDSSSE